MGESLIGSVPLNPPVRLFAPVHDHFPSGEPPLSIGLDELILIKELRNELLRVDTGCLVAFTPGIEYNIARAGNLKSMFFGGEGLFLATLQGTGVVYLQSLPFSRLADRILENTPSAGGKQRGEGSVLGSLDNLVGGR